MQENHGSIVRLLLARPDIRVNMRGMDGHTALIRACFERCVAACAVTTMTSCAAGLTWCGCCCSAPTPT